MPPENQIYELSKYLRHFQTAAKYQNSTGELRLAAVSNRHQNNAAKFTTVSNRREISESHLWYILQRPQENCWKLCGSFEPLLYLNWICVANFVVVQHPAKCQILKVKKKHFGSFKVAASIWCTKLYRCELRFLTPTFVYLGDIPFLVYIFISFPAAIALQQWKNTKKTNLHHPRLQLCLNI